MSTVSKIPEVTTTANCVFTLPRSHIVWLPESIALLLETIDVDEWTLSNIIGGKTLKIESCRHNDGDFCEIFYGFLLVLRPYSHGRRQGSRLIVLYCLGSLYVGDVYFDVNYKALIVGSYPVITDN